ncbi:ATP-binding protein [Paenibacillus sp. GCM10012306]|uniref:sensor histidine kinase n=1 Tax=Paenibacillus sp. GCM10012306 TaxID=3317342 RepID=UPI00360ACEEF
MESVNHKVRKSLSLRTIFLRYLVLLCGGMLLWLGILAVVYMAAVATGGILPANYVEQQITAAKEEMIATPHITREQIPSLAEYALFTRDGKYINGSLNAGQARDAWNSLISGSRGGLGGYYNLIPREKYGETLLLKYTIVMQFNSPWLRAYLPNPELLGIVLLVGGFLLQIVLYSYLSGRKLARKMQGLETVIGKIQNQNLEFTVESSGVKEIDAVLGSLNKMKNELKTSLQQQWEEQQSRREQISALAHDIKTPLTIIRGNAELLSETAQDETQQEYNRYILNSTAQLERYAKVLLDITATDQGLKLQKIQIETQSFLAEIKEQLKAATVAKRIEVEVALRVSQLPKSLRLDKELFQRALLNVLMNAIEYTPEQGRIKLTVKESAAAVRFIVSDSGPGLASADLREATKQFYMGDRSRSAGEHYGMGLYITESIMTKHGGRLLLENDEDLSGAKVTLELPLSS